jgi:hypothetical protein
MIKNTISNVWMCIFDDIICALDIVKDSPETSCSYYTKEKK